MDRKKELLVRMYLVMFAFVMLSIVIIVRVAKVSIVEGDKWRAKGNKNVKLRTVLAERGNIYSEEYNLLATSLKFFEIHMDLTVVKEETFRKNVDSLAYHLNRSIGTQKSQYEWKEDLLRARRNKKRYYPIAKKVTIDEYKELKEFPIFRYGKFRGGLIAQKFERRIKPFKSYASRTIGEDRKNAVKIGLEGYFDEALSGDDREVLMKKVSAQHEDWIPVYDMSEMEQRRGHDLVTTLNVGIQDIVHTELLSRAMELRAKAATAIVMEVETGAIKAISNFRMQKDSTYAEIYNDAIGRLSEPGSTFKLASVLAMMDDGFCDLNTMVDLQNGKTRFYDKEMFDSDWHNMQMVTMQKAFEKSSNVGIAKLTHQFYNSKEGRIKYIEQLTKFGLTNKTGIEISGEGQPFIKHPTKDKSKWYGTTIPWMAHGYELMITPLQMLNLYNTVANDGKMMKPYLVSDILEDDDVYKHFDPKVLNAKIASGQAIKNAQILLEAVVEKGTGKKLQSDKISIAGKTGTTRTNYTRKKEKKAYNASFAGYFPVKNPKYSMIIVMYEPQGNIYYGASAAGPAFKTIAERISILDINTEARNAEDMIVSNDLPSGNAGFGKDFTDVFNYVGVKYKKNDRSRWVEVTPLELNMNIKKKRIKTKEVPDVKGMGARDAVYILENLGMKVDIVGVGKVAKQTIRSGTKLKGQHVTIYLN